MTSPAVGGGVAFVVVVVVVGQLTVSFREGEPMTYTSYDDMEKDFVSGKVRGGEEKGREGTRQKIAQQILLLSRT